MFDLILPGYYKLLDKPGTVLWYIGVWTSTRSYLYHPKPELTSHRVLIMKNSLLSNLKLYYKIYSFDFEMIVFDMTNNNGTGFVFT